MKLQEAVKIVEEYQKWRTSKPPYDGCGVLLPYEPSELTQALDTLIAHAKQPVQVTEEMVEAALSAPVAEGETVFWSMVFGLQNDTDELREIMARGIVRTVLQAALGVK